MSLRRNRVLVGDAEQSLHLLPDSSVDMVLTSPPYFRLRNYDATGQIGMEGHIDRWVAQLRTTAGEVARVLTPSGSFWLNVADTYAVHRRQGAAPKSLLLGPERLLLALVADGWVVRNKIVWSKPNPMPTPVRDRLTCSYELLYLLVRGRNYFFDLDAIRVPHLTAPLPTMATGSSEAWRGPNSMSSAGLVALKRAGRAGHPLGKNPTDVWRIPTSRYRSAHHATFPLTLAERAIAAGCPEARCRACRWPWRRVVERATGQSPMTLGAVAVSAALRATCSCQAPSEPGLVLDPFFGAGTTGVAAERLNRDWLGIEINQTFADVAANRLRAARRARAP